MPVAAWVLISFLFTALWNPGFIALDEYNHAIVHYIPAQMASWSHLLELSGIRSPLQVLPLFALAKLGLFFGIEDPWWQYRFVVICVGLIQALLMIPLIKGFFPSEKNESPWEQKIFAGLLSLHAVAPFALTRPMFETLSAPWLSLSALFFYRFDQRSRRSDLFFSLLFLSLASLLRPQCGICAGAMLLCLLLKKNWRALLPFATFAAICLVLSGLPDLWMRGQLHASLLSYVRYNARYSHTYGAAPFYNYFLVFLGLSLFPIFASRFAGFRWRIYWERFRVPFLYWMFFWVAHSFISHKEERFMIPILPVFFVLLTPWIAYLWQNRTRYKKRLIFAVALNTVILLSAVLNIAQNNVLSLARFVSRRPEITEVIGVHDTLVLFPKAFIPTPGLREIKMPFEALAKLPQLECHQILVVRQDYIERLPPTLALKPLGSFYPGWIEALVVKTNPRKNARRGPLTAFGCPQAESVESAL